MARILWDQFQGEVPRLDPRLLGPYNAVTAKSARLERGNLSPMRGTTALHTFGSAVQTFVEFDGTWLGWNEVAHAVPGPVDTKRLYVTRGAPPEMRYGSATYALALPRPATPPSVAIATGTVDAAVAEHVVYAYTWVTSLGEESQPSPLSAKILVSDGVAVRVSGLAATPPGRLITKQRIYRSQTGATGATDLFFVAEINAALKTVDHDAELSPLVEPIPSLDFDTPPATLRGITEMPNGMMAGFGGRDLLFCEPYQPHAWPRKYRLFTDYPIVGLASFGTSLAVMTTGRPYTVQGLEPSSMAMEELEVDLPCFAARGIVDMGYAAAYPSSDGLVTISAQGARLVTEGLFTREQWDDLRPTSFRAARLGGRYVFSHVPRGQLTRRLGVIDLSGETPFYATHEVAAEALRYDPETGRLLALLEDDVSVVSVDDHDAEHVSYVWRSRPVHLPAPLSFGAILVEGRTIHADPQDFAVRVYADGALIKTHTAWGKVKRLPAIEAQEWQVEIEGDLEVTRVTLAGSPSEIAGG